MGVTTRNRLSRKITLGFLALVSVSIVAIFAFSTTCHQNVTVCRSEETRCGSDEREVRAVSGLDKEDIISDEEQDAQVPFESVSADSSVRQESPSQPVVVATNSVNNHNFQGKRAYALLSYGSAKSLHCATMAAAIACRDVATQRYEVIILRIGKPLDERDIPHGVTQKLVDFPSTKEANGNGARFGKLWVSALSQFDSVVFIDHDVLVRKPLDFLFDIAEQLPDTLVAPRAYWIPQPYMMSGTFALSRGSANQTIHRIMSEVLHDPENDWSQEKWLGDMHWFNGAIDVRDDVTLVSGFYTLLVGEFYPKDAIYSFWANRFGWTSARVLDEAHVIHFIANWKPWGSGIKEARGNTTPELERAFLQWNSFRGRVCRR